MPIAYIRNGVVGWTPKQQREALAKANFVGTIFEDQVTDEQVKKRDIKALIERAKMLDPGRKGHREAIVVATVKCLALSAFDMTSVLAAASARSSSITVLDIGIKITPDAGIQEIAEVVASWERARRNDQTEKARGLGTVAAAVRAKALRKEKIDMASKLWGLPTDEISTDEIAERVGLTVASLYNHLGKRRVAQGLKKSEKATGKA